MKTITIEHETDTAHRLSFHKGKCFNLHGHRYRYVVTIDVEEDFRDFYQIKNVVRNLLDKEYDHITLLDTNIENKELIDCLIKSGQCIKLCIGEPTVENMVDWVWELLVTYLPLRSITIYETPTNYCTRTEEDCQCKNKNIQ